jgi:hypothetical protein
MQLSVVAYSQLRYGQIYAGITPNESNMRNYDSVNTTGDYINVSHVDGFTIPRLRRISRKLNDLCGNVHAQSVTKMHWGKGGMHMRRDLGTAVKGKQAHTRTKRQVELRCIC